PPTGATMRLYACAPTSRPATRAYLSSPGWPGAIPPTGASRRCLAGCSPKRPRPPCSPATATALTRPPERAPREPMTAIMSEETSGIPEVELTAGIVEYEDTGGQGPALVFLHGLIMDSSLWRRVVPGLSPDYRCVL